MTQIDRKRAPGTTRVGTADAVRGAQLDRSSMAERVADLLRELIMQGDLPPGTPLREHDLVGELEVSRNTLREAFRLLSRERLVVYHIHRGVAVRQLTDGDVHDVYRTRAPLELMAIEYSATAEPGALAELDALAKEGEAAAAAADWKRVATGNIHFHQALVDMIGSERISSFFRSINAELRLAFGMVDDQAQFHSPFVPRNRRIAELLLRGDRVTAAQELREYLDEAERLICLGMHQLKEGSADGS
jgi:DNA-binding GntR family transcriptional regulator